MIPRVPVGGDGLLERMAGAFWEFGVHRGVSFCFTPSPNHIAVHGHQDWEADLVATPAVRGLQHGSVDAERTGYGSGVPSTATARPRPRSLPAPSKRRRAALC